MFSLLNGVYDSYLAPTQLNVLVVGASSVGKTTLLERLKVTQIPKRPTQKQISEVSVSEALHQAFARGGAEAHVSSSFSKRNSATTNPVVKSSSMSAPPAPIVVQKRRFHLSICPAPKRYSKTVQDQEEDYILEEPAKSSGELGKDAPSSFDNNPSSPEAPRRVRCHSKEFNVDDIDLMNSATGGERRLTCMEIIPLDDAPELPSLASASETTEEPTTLLLQEHFQECHLKAKARMLPMNKIRPTIGSNLAKIEMYGAKCHFFDVGGKMQNLWERYYDDCDAVIFCWKLGDDPEAPTKDKKYDDDDDMEDFSKQQEILNLVRKAISDDIPFLIFGHVFGNVHDDLVDKMYSTDVVLPHYHNNLTSMCVGSAKTGAGIPQAMEWLIPLAKRQQKERIAARKRLEEEEKEI